MEIEKEDTIEIGKTHNGYFLKNYWVEDHNKDGLKLIESDLTIFEITKGDKEALIKLFYALAEHFGIEYNKYGKNNLDINFNKKGHKLD